MPKLVECYFQRKISTTELNSRLSAPRSPYNPEPDENRVLANVVEAVQRDGNSPNGDGYQVTILNYFDISSLPSLPQWLVNDESVCLCLHRLFSSYSLPISLSEPATDQVICGVTNIKSCELRKKKPYYVS